MHGAGGGHCGAARSAAGGGEGNDPAAVVGELELGHAARVLGVEAQDLAVDQIRLLEAADGLLPTQQLHLCGIHKIGEAAALGKLLGVDLKAVRGQKHVRADRLQLRKRPILFGEGVDFKLISVFGAEYADDPVEITDVGFQNREFDLHCA